MQLRRLECGRAAPSTIDGWLADGRMRLGGWMGDGEGERQRQRRGWGEWTETSLWHVYMYRGAAGRAVTNRQSRALDSYIPYKSFAAVYLCTCPYQCSLLHGGRGPLVQTLQRCLLSAMCCYSSVDCGIVLSIWHCIVSFALNHASAVCCLCAGNACRLFPKFARRSPKLG